MPTGYGDFRQWLIKNYRHDVILELQSAYPTKIDSKYLLWSEFEKALGEYDINVVINWSWESLYLTQDSVGNQLFNNSYIDTQIPDIIDEAFTKWIRGVQISSKKVCDYITQDALYLSFNYTDTLEQLYNIPESQVLHIHGRASKGEKLIVGHNHYITPSDYWDDAIDLRENNERMQRLADMNNLCKPVFEIIERYECFFKGLSGITDINVIGHSCDEIDYPYFKKIRESVARDVKWHFNPFEDNKDIDIRSLKCLIKEIGINPNNTTGVF